MPPKDASQSPQRLRKPAWMKRDLPRAIGQMPLTGMLRDLRLTTVCEEAKCPNRNECFSHGTATFMIHGDTCTRSCAFCAVKTGLPANAPDPDEPEHVAEAVARLKLKHAVITSVNRDDLADGGAGHWKLVVQAVRRRNPTTTVEVLTPDFQGKGWQADIVLEAQPDVYNHNIETTPSLTRRVRVGAQFARSLDLLRHVKQQRPDLPTKSGIMLGLGEERGEVIQTFQALREVGVDMLTIGQYLQPTEAHLPVVRYVTPEEFDDYRYQAMMLGFSSVYAGVYVRSSYNASETFLNLKR